jgi:opacity protein-like surface antigen
MQTQMARVRVFVLVLAAACCGATTIAHAQARSTTLKQEPTRLRVTAAKALLRATCDASGTARASLSRGDELDVVRQVNANWYRVRVVGSAQAAGGPVEGCVSATSVEPIGAPSTSSPASSSSGSPSGTSSGTSSSGARQRPTTPPPAAAKKGGKPRPFGVSGFVDLGQGFFKAKDSFDAILDSSSGPFFGGGGEVRLPWNLFARVDITRFQKDGERAFVSGTDVFKLGIPTTIRVMPIEVTGGYRYPLTLGGRPRPRQPPPRGGKPAPASASSSKAPGKGFTLVPYGGAGFGSVQYKETSSFAQANDDVDERFSSYHVLAGLEVPIWWRLGAAVEYQHRWVPDALGTSGVSKEFNETDLGGGTFRIRFMVSF